MFTLEHEGKLVGIDTKGQKTPPDRFAQKYLKDYVARHIAEERVKFFDKHHCSTCVKLPDDGREKHKEQEWDSALASGRIFKI